MKTAALVGNPNCGKTTLLNALTGLNYSVGNWPGVTVERKEAIVHLKNTDISLIDLPGAYSLEASSLEERVTAEFLKSEGTDFIINVLDAACLERSLLLTLSLLSLNKPMILVVNMADELFSGGGFIDINALSGALGIDAVLVSAKQKTGLSELEKMMEKTAALSRPGFRNDSEESSAKARNHRILLILKASGYKRGTQNNRLQKALDKLFTGRFTAYPILLVVLLIVFYMAFGVPGTYLTGIIELLSKNVYYFLKDALLFLPRPLASMLLDGAFSGFQSVLTFLPQVSILYVLLSFIEDTGYMARAAFITDRALHKLGLSGKSIIPLIMGYGCTASAVCAARLMDNESQRKMTVMLTPCMSCGAKIPVYALISRAFFPGYSHWAVLSLYIIGIAALVLTAIVLKSASLTEPTSAFIMELPPYRIPTPSGICKKVSVRVGDFAKRAGNVIVIMSVASWFLSYFTIRLSPAGSMSESIFGAISSFLRPAFAPLGFSSFEAVCALLSGLVAKEGIISTLQVLFKATDMSSLSASLSSAFSGSAGAYAFLVFVLLYPPCICATASIRRELNSRRMLLRLLFLETAMAYLFALIAYRIGSLFI